MLKIICLTVLLAFTTASFSQQLNQQPLLQEVDYLQKSKNQKKIAWILLAGGAALTITSFVIPEGEETDFNPQTWEYDHKNDGIKAGLGIGGGLAMLGSIPFFIASGRNKKKANAITAFLQMERATVIREAAFIQKKFPAVGIAIKF